MANDFASRQHFLRELGTSDSKVVGSSEWPEVSIVIVPSASRSRATHLKHTSWAWLAQIACDARVQGRYYEFQPISTSAGTSVWQSLSDDGDSLLHLLLELGSEAESASPIILISDGLGGISTKKALTRLSERYFEPAIRHLSDRITKAIFIGCPHPTLGNKAQWPFLDHVLRHDRGMDSAARKAAAEEAGIVASLCTKFEEAGSYCPIITTYESQPTTLRHGFNFLRPQRRVLVSRDFAKTCVKGEETVPLDLDKRDIRSISKDSAFTRVFKQRVRSCLTEANERFRLAEQRILHPATCAGNPFASTASEAPGSIDADHHHHQHQHHQQQQHQQENLPLDTSYISAGATRGKSPQLPCYVFGSHPRNPGFFGRSDILAQIDNSILPRGQDLEGRDAETVRSFAICGIGGMGKTQIALEYAYSRKTSFDAIFWITANTKTSIAESFSTIAMSLGIATDTETTDLAVCFSIVLRWLSNPTKTASTQQASWLLIFDNADDIGLMSEYWPHTGVGSVLVTTRDLEGRNFCLGKGVLLQRLSESNALEFFKARLNKHAEMEQLVDPGFVERFGGLPLAIVQVASLIRRRQLTTDEFSEAYGSDLRQSGLDQPQASQHDGGYRHSIFTVWAFESLDETAQALLNLMSLLDPFRIQESILAGDGVADLPHSAYPRSKVDYLNARSALLKTSIVIRSIPTEHVELHPFVQEVVRTRMSKEELRTYFSVAVALVHASWPSGTVKWIHAASRRQQIGSLLPHALKLLAEYERSLLATPLSALTCDLFVNNLQECAWYLYERGEHASALPILTIALEIARGRSHENPKLLADVLMCLAALTVHTSSADEVVKYAGEHLEVRQQVYDACAQPGEALPPQVQYDHAMGVATMAMAYNCTGEFEKSIPYAFRSLELYRSFPKYHGWKTIPYFAVAHAGWALWSVGRYEEAEQILSEAVNAHKKFQTGGSYGLAGLLLPLGNVLMALGRASEATPIHEEAVEMFYAANGDNYKTAQARLKHAEHLGNSSLGEEAMLQYRLAIDAFSHNTYYKPELARAQIKAARYLLSLGKTEDGQELMARAQETLDRASINAKASKMSEASMSRMVRIWSR